MKVIITKEMVRQHPHYCDIKGCALYFAIKEQHPEINLSAVGPYGHIYIIKK